MGDKLKSIDQIIELERLNEIENTENINENLKNELKLILSYKQECKFPNEQKLSENKGIGISKLMRSELDKADENAKDIRYVDYEIVEEALSNNYYSNSVMNNTSCIISNILKNDYLIREMLSVYVIDIQAIQKATVIIFNIKDTNVKFVAKWETSESLLNEVVASIFVANEMRKVLPTFVWFYGITTCNLPIISYDKEIITGCNLNVSIQNEDYIGLISEYVEGLSLYEYCKSDEFNSHDGAQIIMIIMCSIFKAFCKFKFVHYDLHLHNIRLRRTDGKFKYIKFQENFYIELPNNYLPTIIDFGLSSFELNNVKYGSFEYNFDPYNQSIFIDTVKFLYEMYLNSKKLNKDKRLYNALSLILSYLIDNLEDDFEEYLLKNNSIIYDTKNLDKNMNPSDLILLINDSFEKNDIFVVKNNVNKDLVIPCTYKQKLDYFDFFKRSKINNIVELQSVMDDQNYFVINKVNEYISKTIRKQKYIKFEDDSNQKLAILEIIKINEELHNLANHMDLIKKLEKIINERYKGIDGIENVIYNVEETKGNIKRRMKKLLNLVKNTDEKANLNIIDKIIKMKKFKNKKYGNFNLLVNERIQDNVENIIKEKYKIYNKLLKTYNKYIK